MFTVVLRPCCLLRLTFLVLKTSLRHYGRDHLIQMSRGFIFVEVVGMVKGYHLVPVCDVMV